MKPSRLALLFALPMMISSGRSVAEHVDFTLETPNAAVEAQEGERLHVVFANETRPALLWRPARGVWDWSATSKLVLPVENPDDEALTLQLQIEDAAGRLLSGETAIAPHSGGDLTIPIDAPSPRTMGMLAGPSLKAAGLAPNEWPVTKTQGSIDASSVISVRLGVRRRAVARHLTVGLLRVEPPSEEDKAAYDRIVDSFGQFRRGTWPQKVTSTEMLRARGAEEVAQLAQWCADIPKPDRFGGLLEKEGFRASGFFRTERRGGRWWLVTPEGNPFFSIGMDVVSVAETTYVEGREFMFDDLPARDGDLAGRWSEPDDRPRPSGQRGRGFNHGLAFDFYAANLERKFGADWLARWREESAARLQAWGFNTIGNWSDPDLSAMHRLPYTAALSPEGDYAKVSSGEDWLEPIPDPFDPRFDEAVDNMARHASARFHGDPYLIGYFVDNELSWGLESPTNPRKYYALAINALAAGPASPAKSAFVAYLIGIYREPKNLAQDWGLPIASWDALRDAGLTLPSSSLDKPAVIRDLAAFTKQFAEAYFRTVAEALRRHDPDHLYLGSRFAWQTNEAVEACAHWCDLVSFNRYVRSIDDDPDEWARFHKLGKPALIGEFHFGSVDSGLFWEGILGVGKEGERGRAYSRYLRAVADNPDFVGAHWFQYVDEPLTGRTIDGENAHIGFVTVADLPYDDLVVAARSANLAVLRQLQRSSE